MDDDEGGDVDDDNATLSLVLLRFVFVVQSPISLARMMESVGDTIDTRLERDCLVWKSYNVDGVDCGCRVVGSDVLDSLASSLVVLVLL